MRQRQDQGEMRAVNFTLLLSLLTLCFFCSKFRTTKNIADVSVSTLTSHASTHHRNLEGIPTTAIESRSFALKGDFFLGECGVMVPAGQTVLAVINIQKTGSTLFNLAFCEGIRNAKHGNNITQAEASHRSLRFTPANNRAPSKHHLQKKGRTADSKASLSSSHGRSTKTRGLRDYEDHYFNRPGHVHLYDFCEAYKYKSKYRCEHHIDLPNLRACLSRLGTPIFMTMLRDPVQRAISEFHHNDGLVMNEGRGAWRAFQPQTCGPDGRPRPYVQSKELPEGDDGGYTPLNPAGVAAYMEERGRVLAQPGPDGKQAAARALLAGAEGGGGAPGAAELFRRWVGLGAANPGNNRMARMLAGPLPCAPPGGGVGSGPGPTAVEDQELLLASAKANLERHVLFGLQGDYAGSLRLLGAQVAALLARDKPDPYLREHFRLSPRFAGREVNTLHQNVTGPEYAPAAAAAAVLREHNRADLALYAHAVELFAARARRLGVEVAPPPPPPPARGR